MKLLTYALLMAFSFSQITFSNDKREYPTQLTSGGMVLMGLYTMTNLQPKALFRNILRIPAGACIAAAGAFGLCYAPTILKAADSVHDSVAETYKQSATEHATTIDAITATLKKLAHIDDSKQK